MSARQISLLCFPEPTECKHTLLITVAHPEHAITHITLSSEHQRNTSLSHCQQSLIDLLTTDEESNAIIICDSATKIELAERLAFSSLRTRSKHNDVGNQAQGQDSELLIEASEGLYKTQAELQQILVRMTQKVENKVCTHNLNTELVRIEQELTQVEQELATVLKKTRAVSQSSNLKKLEKRRKGYEKRVSQLNSRKNEIHRILKQGQPQFLKDLKYQEPARQESSDSELQLLHDIQ